jgi:hypothetical protein
MNSDSIARIFLNVSQKQVNRLETSEAVAELCLGCCNERKDYVNLEDEDDYDHDSDGDYDYD